MREGEQSTANQLRTPSVTAWPITPLLIAVNMATDADKRKLARLRSCACQASAAWLTVLPTVLTLEAKDSEVCTTMKHRLGILHMPSNMCEAHTSAAGSNQAMI
jgi:hypothetical protein